MFSDATGQFEAVIFSDTLATAGNLLEPGTPVLLGVSAERDGDTVKMRVESLRFARRGGGRRAARPQARARPAVIEKNAGALAAIKSRLKPGGKGEIRLVLPLGRPRQRDRVQCSRALRRLANRRRDSRHHPRRCPKF